MIKRKVSVVPRPIGFDLLSPEVGAGAGPFEQMAVVAMPEAAVNENDGLEAGEDHVRLAGKPLVMQPVAQSTLVQRGT